MNDSQRIDAILEKLRDLLPELQRRYAVSSLEVFGSFVRGEEQEGSDIDLLVTFDETPSLFRFIELENLLSEELGLKVDLVMKDSLKPALGERILQEAQPV